MRWDDLQLLRLIDHLETTEAAVLSRPFALIERAAKEWNRQVDYAADARLLAEELLLAREAGYLTFNDEGYGGRPTDPMRDPHYWLQQIGDLRLTLPGRDRARGRVIVIPTPDANEDDGRIVTGATLEEIARAIGETFTAAQLPRFLRDSGLPPAFVPDKLVGDRWQYVMAVLEALVEDGSAARRSFRTFVGMWLTGQLHTTPSEKVRRRIVSLLGQQGWHVKDSVLVIGDRMPIETGALSPLDKDARIAALHPNIRQAVDRFIESDHLDVAIFEAFKSVNLRVKAMSGLSLDGQELMAKAFGDDRDPNPSIALADLATETGRNIQSGFRFMFMGAVRGIRNPDAHELFEPVSEAEAFEELGFASMLMRRLDDAVNRRQR
jgi:uncharacterized protein (TIGR02391 family)